MKKFSRVKQIQVSAYNPHQYDALGREKDCFSLVDFIKNSEPPFTLAVDAEWGNGKTIFIEMLRAHLSKEGFRSVFFNAWECDFCEDPLAPLIVEISKEFSEDPSMKEKIKSMGNAVLQVIKAVAPLIPSPIQPALQATFNILDFVGGNLETEKSGPIEDYEKYRDALEKFRNCLEEFASKDEKGYPLVVFIDDLDRCRPDFAVKVLERVKHIFDVSSLFFVIAINKKEFSSIVKSFYGCEDGEKYLEKFFDLVFHLRNDRTLIESSLAKIRFDRFQKKVRKSSHIDIEESTHRKWIASYIEPLCRTFQFTLRVQEKLVKMLEITLDKLVQTLDEDHYQPVSFTSPLKIPSIHKVPIQLQYPLLCYFLALRIANPSLFHRSVESRNIESIPWEEHIEFYFQELGVGRKPRSVMQSLVNTSSLEAIKPTESKLIALCLVALFNLPEDRSLDQLSISDHLKAEIKDIAILMKIDNYFDFRFRKFLASIDFAGRFYEPENIAQRQ